MSAGLNLASVSSTDFNVRILGHPGHDCDPLDASRTHCAPTCSLNWQIDLPAGVPGLSLHAKATGSALQGEEFIRCPSIKPSSQRKKWMLRGADADVVRNTADPQGRLFDTAGTKEVPVSFVDFMLCRTPTECIRTERRVQADCL